MQPDRFAAIRNAGVLAVVQAYGGVDLVRSGSPGYGLTPCLVCGQATRHRKSRDKRGAIGLTHDGMGWRCFQCGAGGDAVSLVAAKVTGTAKPTPEGWRIVRAYIEQHRPSQTSSVRLQAPRRVGPNRPPSAEVHSFWDACVPVIDDTEVSLWLNLQRGLDPARIADFDLARAVPGNIDAPSWARRGDRPWSESGYRLVVPLYNCRGELSSLHARNVHQNLCGNDKATSPTGFSIKGLIMACPLSRLWLAGERLGDGSSAANYVACVGLVIAEGLPDWLTWVSQYSDADERAPALIGIVSGGWTVHFADKVPPKCMVTIASHHDIQGNKYANHIASTLCHRVRADSVQVRRSRPFLRTKT
ncbi:MAG: hypothetical protein R3C68_01590 [Myxococcota bacterium]